MCDLSTDDAGELIARHAKPAKSEEALLRSEERPPALDPVIVLQGGFVQGTYVVKELVYAYAMWISAAFHLHVIRAYDALVMERHEAPPVVPVSVTHRADVLVSATRTFAALTRVGRTLRMSHSRALAAANAATLRATGIDLVQEMEAGDLVTGGLKALPDGLPAQLAVWLEGRDEVTTHDIAVGIGLDAPDSIAVQQRIADAMRTLGWRKVRSARPERQWKWVR